MRQALPLDNLASVGEKWDAKGESLGRILLFALAVSAHGAGFDHALHLAHEKAKDRFADCVGCHKLGPKQLPRMRMGHKDCSGSGCHAHQALEAAVAAGRAGAAFCKTCHVDPRNELKKRRLLLRSYAGRRPGEGEFGLASFTHASHSNKTVCAGCHALDPSTKGPPSAAAEMRLAGHAACGNELCHGGPVKPALTDCAACHTAGAGRGGRAWDPYRVSYAFSHHTHPMEQQGGAADCKRCHSNVETGKGQGVPLPRKADCVGCHNDAPVPGVTGTNCMYCHKHPEGVGAK